MTNGNTEPTLANVVQQLTAIQQEQAEIKKEVVAIRQQLDKLDGRFFDFSMRVVSANQSAFYSVGLALLSAAIAFVVARVSSSGM